MDANNNPVWYVSPTFLSKPWFSIAEINITVLEITRFVASTEHVIHVITCDF